MRNKKNDLNWIGVMNEYNQAPYNLFCKRKKHIIYRDNLLYISLWSLNNNTTQYDLLCQVHQDTRWMCNPEATTTLLHDNAYHCNAKNLKKKSLYYNIRHLKFADRHIIAVLLNIVNSIKPTQFHYQNAFLITSALKQ